MNKLTKSIITIGAVAILALVIALYFISQKVTKNIEERINTGLHDAQNLLRENPDKYNISDFTFEPFECHGLMDYTCKSSKMSIFVTDPTTRDNTPYENVQLSDIILDLKDIKSKKRLSLSVKTNVGYPNIDKFFGVESGDSNNDLLISFLNKNAQALLPSTLECSQDYNLKDVSEDSKSSIITLNTICDFNSALLNTNLTTTNVFNPPINKSHILGIFYEIAMANNDDSIESSLRDSKDSKVTESVTSTTQKRQDLQLLNIPHELEFINLTLKNKQTFKEFLANNKSLDDKQKAELQANFNGAITSAKMFSTFGSKIFGSYLGGAGEKIISSLIDLAQNNIKEFNVQFSLKGEDFKPLEAFYTRNIIEWLSYLNEKYDVKLAIDSKNVEISNTKKAIESNETYEVTPDIIDNPSLESSIIDSDSKDTNLQDSKTDSNKEKENDLMQPPGITESYLESNFENLLKRDVKSLFIRDSIESSETLL
ncbi:hypothetical protein DCO58_06900 [Helicobacter saguini]|uniref:Uncharacterized protein n=1 Tax=Helicobacter saguini TaxID=1548018 RepID=A0A347VN16_9HELI|nr:hypothetical protein [Helicobacter saguini]MWV61939.1 hypothetical protein [Helicobacter saguini]MWV67386.1 hypothetical protein [Helicobacter saguini]MWV69739.1 hypothetical protein [Helicobacter saguini]MWV73044.1 hypothetical protein [Helicobacter saguini]TLD95580.1 hypothetical protein LS64_001625 [Helicobacter saguini]